jgi:AcrR family transcriptional regulator
MNEKQNHILQIAQELFSEKGFSATSVRDIADKAQVNISMISYYFGGKDGLLKALIETRIGSMKIRLKTILSDPKLTPNDKINILIEESISKFWSHRELNNIILREHNFKLVEELKNLLLQIRQSRYEHLAMVIQEGQAEGIFRKDINIPLLQAALTGFMKHIHFAEDYYQSLLNFENKKNRETLLVNEMKTFLKNLFKSYIHENSHK